MIVCVCNNVSEREIEQAVELGARTIADLRNDLGVASCCGKCHTCAKQVLKASLQANAEDASKGCSSHHPALPRQRSIALMLA